MPVDQLPELARALLSEDLGGRDAVPAHVAERVAALAAQWADHGFTAQTVRPWADLTPESAAYLAGRGVPPHALDQQIDAGGSAAPLTVRMALSTGRLTAAQAYELLAGTGLVPSPTGTPPSATGTGAPPSATGPDADPTAADDAARATPAPVLFSHAGTEHPADGDRGGRHGTTGRPSRTPFRR